MHENSKLAHEMRLVNPVEAKSTCSLVPYSSEYQEAYKKMYNSCYHEMREALHIEPYDFIQDDSFFDSKMDSVYCLIKDGILIGSVALKGKEIDDLLVAIDYQGRGIGRDILLWAIEHISAEPVILHVADWNKRAIRLYESLGFEIIKTFEIGR
jgi:GNAT superfamily N-acetyltransferase